MAGKALLAGYPRHVTDKESDYAECDLDLESDGLVADYNLSSSEEMHSFGESSNISDTISLSLQELCLSVDEGL